ncbi:GNAT family N-acetyltransferase [Xylanimonas oleitrophica]|nr:GNAT family N-acetyltransferase [Xylanimonas oleitrophica]
MSDQGWSHGSHGGDGAAAGGPPVCVVVDVPDESRYEAHDPQDGEVMGYLEYHRRGDVVVMPHTVTLPQFRGRGVAAAMAERALDDVAAAGGTVEPLCWYVAEYVARHERYQRLLARPS